MQSHRCPRLLAHVPGLPTWAALHEGVRHALGEAEGGSWWGVSSPNLLYHAHSLRGGERQNGGNACGVVASGLHVGKVEHAVARLVAVSARRARQLKHPIDVHMPECGGALGVKLVFPPSPISRKFNPNEATSISRGPFFGDIAGSSATAPDKMLGLLRDALCACITMVRSRGSMRIP